MKSNSWYLLWILPLALLLMNQKGIEKNPLEEKIENVDSLNQIAREEFLKTNTVDYSAISAIAFDGSKLKALEKGIYKEIKVEKSTDSTNIVWYGKAAYWVIAKKKMRYKGNFDSYLAGLFRVGDKRNGGVFPSFCMIDFNNYTYEVELLEGDSLDPSYPTATVWDGSSSSLWSDTANWSTSAIPTSGDSVVFNSGAVACSLTENSICSIFVSTSGYTEKFKQPAGKTLTVKGSFTYNGTTLDLQDTLRLSQDGDFQLGSSLTSTVISDCYLDLRGTGVFDNDEIGTLFKIVSCAYSGKTTTVTSAGNSTGCGVKLIGNGGTLTLNANFYIGIVNRAGAFYSLATTTVNGTATLTCAYASTSVTADTMTTITMGGTTTLALTKSGTAAATIIQSGTIRVPFFLINNSRTTAATVLRYNSNGDSVMARRFVFGAYATAAICTLNCGASKFLIDSVDFGNATYNKGKRSIFFQASEWLIGGYSGGAGNFVNGDSLIFTPGTSTINFVNTSDTCNILSKGKAFHKIIQNGAAGNLLIADTLIVDSLYINNGSFHSGNKPLTACSLLVFGNTSAGTCAANFGSSPVTVGAVDTSLFSNGTIAINMGSSVWDVRGNFRWNKNITMTEGTSVVNFTTNNSAILSQGRKFNDIVFNGKGKTYSLLDSLQSNNVTITNGIFNQSGKALRISGNLIEGGGENLTNDGWITLTGKDKTFQITSRGTISTASCSLSMADSTVLKIGNGVQRTFGRVVFANGKTYTIANGDTLAIGKKVPADISGGAGSLVKIKSLTAGNGYTLNWRGQSVDFGYRHSANDGTELYYYGGLLKNGYSANVKHLFIEGGQHDALDSTLTSNMYWRAKLLDSIATFCTDSTTNVIFIGLTHGTTPYVDADMISIDSAWSLKTDSLKTVHSSHFVYHWWPASAMNGDNLFYLGLTDYIHPNLPGYAAWGNILRDSLIAVLGGVAGDTCMITGQSLAVPKDGYGLQWTIDKIGNETWYLNTAEAETLSYVNVGNSFALDTQWINDGTSLDDSGNTRWICTRIDTTTDGAGDSISLTISACTGDTTARDTFYVASAGTATERDRTAWRKRPWSRTPYLQTPYREERYR